MKEACVSHSMTCLLNSTFSSLQTVIAMPHTIRKPAIIDCLIDLDYGVSIGIDGDLHGKFVISGRQPTFRLIAENVFQVPIHENMICSSTGELANVLAGGLSTHLAKDGLHIKTTFPTMMKTATQLIGYDQALKVTVLFQETKELDVHLLLAE